MFCSAAPGRRLPATVAPLPACPRTVALRLALCPSLSRVSSFTFVLTRAHLPAFHSHFLTAHNTGTVFLKKILSITFSSVFLTVTIIGIVFLKKNSLNHIFFYLPHHGTVSRAKFPVPDDDGFKLFTSLLLCASHSTSSSTQIQERLEKMILQHCLMDLFEDKFLANNRNSLTQQQWQEILLEIEEAFPFTPPRTWAQVQSKVCGHFAFVWKEMAARC